MFQTLVLFDELPCRLRKNLLANPAPMLSWIECVIRIALVGILIG